MGSGHETGSSENSRSGAGAFTENGNSLVVSEHQSRTATVSDPNEVKGDRPTNSPKRSQWTSASGSVSVEIIKGDSKTVPILGASDVDSSPTSLVSCYTHESSLPFLSPAQSPIRQVMDRNDSPNHDPGRIPDSVFSSMDLKPIDWSAASTESLFSIHIGNSSFSIDHALMMGGDPYNFKSGEPCMAEHLPEEQRSAGELNGSTELVKAREGFSKAEGTDMKNSEVAKDSELSLVADGQTKSLSKGFVDTEEFYLEEFDRHEKLNGKEFAKSSSVNPPYMSGNSVKPLVFPIIKNEKEKGAGPLCCWCNCSWPSSCCKWFSWPSFFCKKESSCCKWFSWPSCSFKSSSWSDCFKRLSCCSFCCKLRSCSYKCPTWPSCCCKFPTWPSCKYHCSRASLALCCSWNCKTKSRCSIC